MSSARSASRFYTVGEAARLLDIHPETLRRWERSGKITTQRTPSGYRVFDEEEILKLKKGFSGASVSHNKVQVSQNVHSNYSNSSSKAYITLRIPRPDFKFPSADYKTFAMLAITFASLAITVYTLFKFTPYPRQAVLGAETFITPALEEGGAISSFVQTAGKTLSGIQSIFKNSPVASIAVPFIGQSQSSSTNGDLEVNGKAVISKDIEGLGNLRIKGTATVSKLITPVVDPYLIENDGSVQNTLEIKSVGDISLEPGTQGSGSVTLGGNNISGVGTLNTNKVNVQSDSSVGGNLTVTGNTTIGGTLTAGTVNGLSSGTLAFSGSSPSIYPTTTNSQISLNAAGTGAINIGNSSTGDIYLGGGSTTGTYCLITNSNGSLNCASDITTGGKLHVNGTSLVTSQTTFNLLNDTATTINFAGGATTLSIGASTGTTTVNNSLTVTGTGTLNGNLTLGSSSSQTLAVNAKVTTSILPNATGAVDLGSSSLKWNNLYSNTINTASINTSGQGVFNYNPPSTAITDASLLINPTTVTNNTSALLGIAVGGVEKARIDNNGNLTLQGGITATGSQSQTYSASSGTAQTLNVTDSASSGTTTVNGLGVALTGTANATGSNILNAINLYNVTAQTNNIFNALNFGTGYNNFITSGTFNLTAGGALSGATTISASGNINSTSGALQTNSITRIDNGGNLTAGTGNFAGDVTASVDNTYALGSSSVRWSAIYVSGDVNAGDVVFNNDFRLREKGKTAIDLLTPDGKVVARFDRLGNIWIKGEIKKLNDN